MRACTSREQTDFAYSRPGNSSGHLCECSLQVLCTVATRGSNPLALQGSAEARKNNGGDQDKSEFHVGLR